MANGKTHRRVGQVAGAGFALYRARDQHPVALVLETLGGRYGGAAGSALHDMLEPATSPNHRDFFHSIAFNGAAIAKAKPAFDAGQEVLRRWAGQRVADAMAPGTGLLDQLLHLLGAGLAHLAVGYLNGFAAGGVSHLALDAKTPRSLPLLTHGF